MRLGEGGLADPADNPLLEEWREYQGGLRWPGLGSLSSWAFERKWPTTEAEIRESADEWSAGRRRRERCVSTYAWAIPNDEALDAIAGLGPIIEVGYWAAMLQTRGVDVIATDSDPPLEMLRWTTVEQIPAAEAAARYPDRVLMVCWPSYSSSMATEALTAYLEAEGRTVIYVGEWDGCTADEDFHELLGKLTEIRTVDIPQWDGVHDYLSVWEAPMPEKPEPDDQPEDKPAPKPVDEREREVDAILVEEPEAVHDEPGMRRPVTDDP